MQTNFDCIYYVGKINENEENSGEKHFQTDQNFQYYSHSRQMQKSNSSIIFCGQSEHFKLMLRQSPYI